MKYVFTADIGTTSLKACVFDENLKLVSQYSIEYKLITDGNCVEFPAEDYFEIFMSAYDRLTKNLKIDGICLDTQGETLIVADEHGKPLYNAINWLDSRAQEEAREIEGHFGIKQIYEITGQPEAAAGFPAPKLLWLKKHKPEIFLKTKKIFLLEDYILYRLTGNFRTERTLQSSSLYLNVNTGDYWKEMLGYIGVSDEQLPALCESGDLAGYYDGIPVFCGALDQIAAMIGAGVVKSGMMSEMTGTTLAVCFVSDKIPRWREGLKAPCHYFSKDKYAIIMWSGTAGMALQWFKDNFCADLDFKQIDIEAEKIPAGSEGLTFLPYLTGSTMPKYNPQARGVFYGIGLNHTRAHFARSVMESVACILKQFIDYVNLDVGEIRSIGGGSKSALWCRIKADVTGKKISTLKNTETACLGAALLAFSGLGIAPDLEEAATGAAAVGKTYYPKDRNSALKAYRKFIALDELLNK